MVLGKVEASNCSVAIRRLPSRSHLLGEYRRGAGEVCRRHTEGYYKAFAQIYRDAHTLIAARRDLPGSDDIARARQLVPGLDDGLALAVRLVPGHAKPGSGKLELLEQCRQRLGCRKLSCVRADSAYYSSEMLNWCRDHGVNYVIAARRDWAAG